MTKKEDQHLSLAQAAVMLGVHPTTLRRWADAGHLPVFVTLGGHRRFQLQDLEAFQEKRRRFKIVGGVEGIWGGRALEETRQVLGEGPDQPGWLAQFDEPAREFHRQLGRRLMGVTIQYIALARGGEGLLDEARQIGSIYAQNLRQRGDTLPQALEMLFFFRDNMLEVALRLPEAAQLRTEANQHLFRRLQDVFNAVELAMVEDYQSPRPPMNGKT
ncbi:MAG: helix-turn-helix domain-containing protein [Anaerolineales bacterium]